MNEIDILESKIKDKIPLYLKVVTTIKKGEGFYFEDKDVDYFVRLGLIEFYRENPDNGDVHDYKLLEDGEKLFKRVRLF